MEQKRSLWSRFQDTHVLIIDEISMLSAEFFAMCDRVLRHMRRTEAPFGGMQVVCSGDFFQLPPVTKNGLDFQYVFESSSWGELNPLVCYLEEQHRHGEGTFLEVLSAIRQQEVTQEMQEVLLARKDAELGEASPITRLYTHNRDVDAINEERLSHLPGAPEAFAMQKAGRKEYVEALARGCLAPETLRLKKGAEVMFVKNDPGHQYFNGTRGHVVGFRDKAPLVKTRDGRIVQAFPVSWKREDESGKILAEIRQMPLRLAWAITVHKSQGMTLDEAEMNLSQCFVPGQGYVALSRVRSLDGLFLRGLNHMALQVDERVVEGDEAFQKRSRKAQERLAQLPRNKIDGLHASFIRARGGSLEPVQKGAKPGKKVKVSTLEQTRALLDKGLPLEKVAKERGLAITTILSHAEKLLQSGARFNFQYLAPEEGLLSDVQEAVRKHGFEKLTPVMRYLEGQGHELSFDDLRKARLYLWSKK